MASVKFLTVAGRAFQLLHCEYATLRPTILLRLSQCYHSDRCLKHLSFINRFLVLGLYSDCLYRAALNAGLSSQENAVCPFIKRVHCDKTEERSVQIFIPHERSFRLVYGEGVTAEALRANIDWKLAFLKTVGQFRPRFLVEGDVPNQPFLHGQIECLTILLSLTAFTQRNF